MQGLQTRLKKNSLSEESPVLECEVTAAFKEIWRNKPPGLDDIK